MSIKTFRKSAFFLVLTLAPLFAQSQDRVQVNIPTLEAETEYIWRTIIDTRFFEENNYQVSLPNGELIESLKQKAKSNSLSDADYEDLKDFMQKGVYNPSDYQRGYQNIEAQLVLVNKMIAEIGSMNLDWNFKEFDIYTVNLTLYGPGGSYNPDEGSLLIYTTIDGRFKQYDNPAHTLIHEVVHMGIEASIVQKYNVPHPLKERIVDTFVSLCFRELLPDYRIQNMGDTRTDPFLKNKADLAKLDALVEQVLR
ncbi:MAG: hypothetical protein RLN81_09595 [Balneolaceae bacterium]